MTVALVDSPIDVGFAGKQRFDLDFVAGEAADEEDDAPRRKPAEKGAVKQKAAPKKSAAKKPAPKKPAKKAAAKRKPNAAFMKPMTPSDALGAVIGAKPMPRTEITKRLWDYIKKNKLQDEVNKRLINADEKLKEVFGGKKQVSMFEMTKLVNTHLK